MDDDLETIYENITELVRPRMLRQEVCAYVAGEWRRKQRDVEIPSLLDQLQAAFVSSSSEQSGTGFGSRPNARIDAMDTIMKIDTEAGNWVDQLGHTIAADLRDNLRWLNEQATRMPDPDRLHDLARDVRGWGTWARITTGWEVPAFRPDNTCPLCAKRGGLRIRAVDGGAQGMCVECGEHWTSEIIGLLSAHIEAENEQPGKVFVELDPMDVSCWFCQVGPGVCCVSGADRTACAPHETRLSLAASGTLRAAS